MLCFFGLFWCLDLFVCLFLIYVNFECQEGVLPMRLSLCSLSMVVMLVWFSSSAACNVSGFALYATVPSILSAPKEIMAWLEVR